jgi:hypothetical protein
MKKRQDFKRTINKIANEWLGKKGIIGISVEKIEGKFYIIFYVNVKDFKDSDYPKELEGYKVIIRTSEKFIPLGKI